MTRRLRGTPNRGAVLVTDTPGLVWNPERGSWTIPDQAQDEWQGADLVLHVIDSSHPEAGRRARHVARLLAASGADVGAPVIPVWTQSDRAIGDGHEGSAGWAVSGRTGVGCDHLIAYLQNSRAWR